MPRFVTLVFLAAVLILAASSVTIAADWPQSFSLYAGQGAKFSFDVAAPGQITVDATWQGCNVAVALTDPSGKLINGPLALKPSPVQIVYTATADDIKKGKTWTVVIGTPPAAQPSQKPVAEGSVNVKIPIALNVPIGSRPPVFQKPINIIRPPTLGSVTPAGGSTNEYVIVKGVSIPEDKTKAEVWFTTKTNTTRQGTIITATKSGDEISYQVRVPGDDYAYQPITGPLCVKLKGTQTVTNSLDFTYVPCAPSIITSHSPQYLKPGVRTTFTGKDFGPNDRVYFVSSTKGNVAGEGTIVSSTTQISAVMPPAFTTNLKSVEVFVRYDCHGHFLDGPKYLAPLDPTAFNSKQKE